MTCSASPYHVPRQSHRHNDSRRARGGDGIGNRIGLVCNVMATMVIMEVMMMTISWHNDGGDDDDVDNDEGSG